MGSLALGAPPPGWVLQPMRGAVASFQCLAFSLGPGTRRPGPDPLASVLPSRLARVQVGQEGLGLSGLEVQLGCAWGALARSPLAPCPSKPSARGVGHSKEHRNPDIPPFVSLGAQGKRSPLVT